MLILQTSFSRLLYLVVDYRQDCSLVQYNHQNIGANTMRTRLKIWFVSMWVERLLEQLMRILINIRFGVDEPRSKHYFTRLPIVRSSLFRQHYLVIVKKEWNIGVIMNSVLYLIVVLLILSQISQNLYLRLKMDGRGLFFKVMPSTLSLSFFCESRKANLLLLSNRTQNSANWGRFPNNKQSQ